MRLRTGNNKSVNGKIPILVFRSPLPYTCPLPKATTPDVPKHGEVASAATEYSFISDAFHPLFHRLTGNRKFHGREKTP